MMISQQRASSADLGQTTIPDQGSLLTMQSHICGFTFETKAWGKHIYHFALLLDGHLTISSLSCSTYSSGKHPTDTMGQASI